MSDTTTEDPEALATDIGVTGVRLTLAADGMILWVHTEDGVPALTMFDVEAGAGVSVALEGNETERVVAALRGVPDA